MGSIVDAFESVLGVAFTEKEMSKLKPDLALFHKLAVAVDDHYRTFQVPEKGDDELRPYISSRFSQLGRLGMDLVSGHFQGGRYAFDPERAPHVADELKKYLLYSHSVCFEDSLPYLLDYFQLDDGDSEYTAPRAPAIKSLLVEYSKVAPLLRRNVVVPVTQGALRVSAETYIPGPAKDALAKRLPEIESGLVGVIANVLTEEMQRARQLGGRVDPFFPSAECVPVYREILRMAQAQFSSDKVREPFDAALLGSLWNIDTRELTVQDLVQMRDNEAIFGEWRGFLKNALTRVYQSQGEYSDIHTEFRAGIRHEMLEWNAKLSKMKKESTLLSRMRESAEQLNLGVISGGLLLLNALEPGQTLTSMITKAAGTASIPLLVKFAFDTVRVSPRRSNYMALRRHFLAIGARSPEAK